MSTQQSLAEAFSRVAKHARTDGISGPVRLESHATISDPISDPVWQESESHGIENARIILLTFYARIRVAIQHFRQSLKDGTSRDLARGQLLKTLSRPTVADCRVLERILVLRTRHPEKKWGNLGKADDQVGL